MARNTSYVAPYVGPVVTTDAVVLRIAEGELSLLTVVRERAPFARALALPGVYVNLGETIARATDRCLATKAKLTLPRGTFRHVLGVRDRVGRDPRGHALSVVVLAVVPSGSAVDGMRPLRETTHLAFDHDEMVSSAVEWLRGHLWSDRTLVAALVGPAALTTATFVGIQQAVQDEGQPIDVSNLRRRLVASGFFESTTATQAGSGRGRPSAVWRWIE